GGRHEGGSFAVDAGIGGGGQGDAASGAECAGPRAGRAASREARMNRGENIETILDRCLARLAGGATLDACLRDFPQHAVELAPLLEAAASLRRWEPPALSDAGRSAARARALAAFVDQRQARAD